MSLMSPVVLCVALVGLCGVCWAQEYAASPWQNYPQQQPLYSTGGAGQGTGCGPGINEVVSNIANYKSNILATGISAAVAALLAKLPALVFLKVLIFKLIVVPALFVLVAVPVLMPLLMMLTPMLMSMMNMMNGGSDSSTTTTTAAPSGRQSRDSEEAISRVASADEVLRAVLSSDHCLERIACKLGVRDEKSEYRKPISWMLKQLQTMVPAEFRDRVKSYRQAYMTGASKGECLEQLFPCNTPELLVKQESRTFRVL